MVENDSKIISIRKPFVQRGLKWPFLIKIKLVFDVFGSTVRKRFLSKNFDRSENF